MSRQSKIAKFIIALHYAALCYALLAMLCDAMLCYAMLCFPGRFLRGTEKGHNCSRMRGIFRKISVKYSASCTAKYTYPSNIQFRLI